MSDSVEIYLARTVIAFKLPQIRDLVARQAVDDYDNPVVSDAYLDRWQTLGVDVAEYRTLRDQYLAHSEEWRASRPPR